MGTNISSSCNLNSYYFQQIDTVPLRSVQRTKQRHQENKDKILELLGKDN